MSGRSIKFLVVIGIGALALLIAGQASATSTIKVPSKISINAKGTNFSGKVTAGSYPPCAQSRKVKLFKVVSGGADKKMGTDTTNAKGKWAIPVSGFAGISLSHFYARVTKSSQGTAGTIYVCNAAKSVTIKPTS